MEEVTNTGKLPTLSMAHVYHVGRKHSLLLTHHCGRAALFFLSNRRQTKSLSFDTQKKKCNLMSVWILLPRGQKTPLQLE